MTSSTSPRIKVFHLPRSHPEPSKWKRLVDKVRQFRLDSLQASPEAFSSTFAREVEFTDDIWIARLTNPLADHVVALSAPGSSSDAEDILDLLIEADWYGSCVLIGPKDDGTHGVSSSQSPWTHISTAAAVEQEKSAGTPNIVPLYHINGVYVVPDARKLGVGQAMIAALLDGARRFERARNGSGMLFQVRVESNNVAAWNLYERAGFTAVGSETLWMAEKERDGVVIPAHEATIIVMERSEILE